MAEKPRNWNEYVALTEKPLELRRLLEARIIELAFTSDNNTAIRAIELAFAFGSERSESPLSTIELKILAEVKERVLQRIIATAAALGQSQELGSSNDGFGGGFLGDNSRAGAAGDVDLFPPDDA
jgi:hypothetical protein